MREFRRSATTQLSRGLSTLRPWSGSRGRKPGNSTAQAVASTVPWVPAIIQRRVRVAMMRRKLNRDSFAPVSKLGQARCGHLPFAIRWWQSIQT